MNKNKETIETDDLKMRLGLSQSKNIQLIVEKKNTTYSSKTREVDNYSDVLPLKAAQRDQLQLNIL